MGLDFQVLGVRGIKKELIWNRLGIEPAPEESGSDIEELISGFYLAHQWYLVKFSKYGYSASDSFLAKVSEGAEVIRADIYEGTNYSSTSYWNNQNLAWQVSHDASHAKDDLQIEGSPPSILQQILDGFESHRRFRPDSMGGNSYFSVPPALFTLTTGYAPWRIDRVKPDHIEILRPRSSNTEFVLEKVKAGKYPVPAEFNPPVEITDEEMKLIALLEPALDWLDVHRADLALAIVEQVERDFPERIYVMWVKTKCLEEMRNERELKTLLRKITETEARTKRDYLHRAMAFSQRGFDEQARQDAEKAYDEYNRLPLAVFGVL